MEYRNGKNGPTNSRFPNVKYLLTIEGVRNPLNKLVKAVKDVPLLPSDKPATFGK